MISIAPHIQEKLKAADGALRARNPAVSERICTEVLADRPDIPEAHLILARAQQMQGRFDEMLASIEAAQMASPGAGVASLMQIEALITLGEIAEAETKCKALKQHAGGDDPLLLGRVAELETQLGLHENALETLRRASALAPHDRSLSFNLASAEVACGELDSAERRLDALLAQYPHDYDAYYNRATLRTQTPERNHIDALKKMLGECRDLRGEFALAYALAKECEDTGEYNESFSYLTRGAAARKRLLQYRVETDLEAMASIKAAFDASFFANEKGGADEEGPVFILGLPRSGTTLIDRILSTHPDIESAGEINDLAHAVTRHCAGAATKGALIQRSTTMNFEALGRQYMGALKQRQPGARYVIDKTPLNFLYIGLIAKAMPGAKIVHVNRDPMDVGFAMYKTLFRMGYPFSYDLTDIGRYMRAKTALMDHWRAFLGARIIDVSYEGLVADQKAESRKLVAALGLDWREECLAFHKSKTPTATASAAQVRRPIYESSVGKWKLYERHLGALANCA